MQSDLVWKTLLSAILGCFAIEAQLSCAQTAVDRKRPEEIKILAVRGTVEVSPLGATTWVRTGAEQPLYPHDRLRTGADSLVTLRWSDSDVTLGAFTEVEILVPDAPDELSGLHLLRGIISFFHRDDPGRIHIITRGAVAGVEGTEFVLSVEDNELTTMSVINGIVRFGNERAMLVLTNGQQAIAEPGNAPLRTPGFVANNVLQWCFYYPAVLDLDELPLSADERHILEESLTAYRAGDLPAAQMKYPAGRQPDSGAEQIYHAALMLAVGQVERAEAELGLQSSVGSERLRRLSGGLRELISAVKNETVPSTANPQLATEFLAASYLEQSRAIPRISLQTALDLAKQAAAHSPENGFAWARVAELEIGFGHTDRAQEALAKSLRLSPRNAQALALKGFLLAGQNRPAEAIGWFAKAIAVDPGLGNAWLGRGLCRIRLGDAGGGREDLVTAAALEPQRAELRSYLGKAYANAGDRIRAAKELQLAKQLDPNDPTAWLYSALLNQEDRQINQGVQDLEKSEDLNENRRVYRSQFLLDQDQAVRSADLAGLYRDAGMFDVSVREAARAVNQDYANYSAHLFLASSYDELTDPIGMNLRYETAAKSEFLVANLLAPAEAGALSPAILQQDYPRLFGRDRLGVVSSTEYLGRGAWTESAAQYGSLGNFNYDLESYYHSDPGQRLNNDIEQSQFSLAVKQQLTRQDSVYFGAQEYESSSGDIFQYYNPSDASASYRTRETQQPIVSLGYHHEWNPGIHTLLLATRLDDTFSLTNMAQPTLVTVRPDIDPINQPGVTMLTSVRGITMHEDYRDKLSIYSGELQQIFQQAEHTTVLGARIQAGQFHTDNLQNQPSDLGPVFPPPPSPAAQQDAVASFDRASVYAYHQWQIADPLQLTAGLAYDWIKFPENFESMPISMNDKTESQLSPKAGMIWTPVRDTAIRFAYTRSIAGASLDQSYQLEPVQVAGFVQSFRNIIPESVTGPSPGAKFETFDLSVERRFQTRTYLGLSGEILNSHVRRMVGAFDVLPDELDFAVPSGLEEQLDYREKSLQFTINQLIAQEWSFGAKYRLSQAALRNDFVDVPDGLLFANFQPRQSTQATLQQLDLTVIYNNPKGFFAEGEALWYAQSNQGYSPDEPGDDFWQLNVLAGYRSPGRKIEAQVGLLNITDRDYNLNPLNVYNELPRKRTLAVRLRLSF